jgi:hypothetical protein
MCLDIPYFSYVPIPYLSSLGEKIPVRFGFWARVGKKLRTKKQDRKRKEKEKLKEQEYIRTCFVPL